MKVTVDELNRIVLPKEIRCQLDIKERTYLKFLRERVKS